MGRSELTGQKMEANKILLGIDKLSSQGHKEINTEKTGT